MSIYSDLQRMILDYFQIGQQRHVKIMATIADVTAKLTEMNTAIDAKIAAHELALANLNMAVNKAMATLADISSAEASNFRTIGQAADLDTVVAGLGDTMTKIDGIHGGDKMDALTAQLIEAIANLPPPVA